MNNSYFLALTFGMAAVTFLNRYSFIGIAGKLDMSERVRKMLRFVPVTVLPAIITVQILGINSHMEFDLHNPKVIAAIICTLISLRFGLVWVVINGGWLTGSVKQLYVTEKRYITMKIISTKNAPAAIGPYVQGINTGNMVMTSCQLPVDPLSGTMSAAIEVQACQSLENVITIVEAAGLTVGNIIKTTVYVKDLNDFSVVNVVYEAFFTKHCAPFPARSCVEVARLPKDAKIEIEAIAIA